jgi:hypothetical protein
MNYNYTYEQRQALIEKDEEAGREYVKKHILENYYHLPENYYYFRPIDDKVDVDITATTESNKIYTYVGEIKKRNWNFDYNSTYKWMLEIKKYNSLSEEHERTGDRRLYFNVFTNDMVVCWDLEKLNFDNILLDNGLFNATTSFQTKDKYKNYYDLPYKVYGNGEQVHGVQIFQIINDTETKLLIKQ